MCIIFYNIINIIEKKSFKNLQVEEELNLFHFNTKINVWIIL